MALKDASLSYSRAQGPETQRVGYSLWTTQPFFLFFLLASLRVIQYLRQLYLMSHNYGVTVLASIIIIFIYTGKNHLQAYSLLISTYHSHTECFIDVTKGQSVVSTHICHRISHTFAIRISLSPNVELLVSSWATVSSGVNYSRSDLSHSPAGLKNTITTTWK